MRAPPMALPPPRTSSGSRDGSSLTSFPASPVPFTCESLEPEPPVACDGTMVASQPPRRNTRSGRCRAAPARASSSLGRMGPIGPTGPMGRSGSRIARARRRSASSSPTSSLVYSRGGPFPRPRSGQALRRTGSPSPLPQTFGWVVPRERGRAGSWGQAGSGRRFATRIADQPSRRLRRAAQRSAVRGQRSAVRGQRALDTGHLTLRRSRRSAVSGRTRALLESTPPRIAGWGDG